eukprot:CAMPEP_0180569004 /NCGR_PEP_ID=MMETSP1037_2-20121125/7453_1 /TAXON_ID=632150 /ORGANISM="Azadinium spinosum, Strain 3D9" /LENGTH=80 /DNA_ID=CAMNT_0022586223 /DNA_START=506 /DNA_END=744 /DNA_ORIENTATION=-
MELACRGVHPFIPADPLLDLVGVADLGFAGEEQQHWMSMERLRSLSLILRNAQQILAGYWTPWRHNLNIMLSESIPFHRL